VKATLSFLAVIAVLFGTVESASAAPTVTSAKAHSFTCDTHWSAVYNSKNQLMAKGCLNHLGNIGIEDELSDGLRVAYLWEKTSNTSVKGICYWAGGAGTMARCTTGINFTVGVSVAVCDGSKSSCSTFGDYGKPVLFEDDYPFN